MREQPIPVPAIVIRFRRALIVAFQLLVMVAANLIAFQLRFDNGVPPWAAIVCWQMLPWLPAIRAATFMPFRLYEGFWRYTSIHDLRALVSAISVSSILFYAFVKSPLGPGAYPRSVFFVDAILLLIFLGGARLIRRVLTDGQRTRSGKRVLVYGAGDAGELIVRDMIGHRDHPYEPVGFIDDNPGKIGLRIHGVPVLGTRHDLPAILARSKADEILLAMPNVEPAVAPM